MLALPGRQAIPDSASIPIQWAVNSGAATWIVPNGQGEARRRLPRREGERNGKVAVNDSFVDAS
jgi:hypothetical protein